ncbi:MAG: MTH1187 family thiamine-binding protein [Candidatus Nitrosopolaris sp.]
MTTLHAEISIVPIGTGSTGISKEVAAAFDAIRKTKDIKTTKLTAMGTQVEANDMRAILNAIEAAHQAVKLTGAKRIISSIRIAERLDASKTLEDEVGSVTEKFK